MSVIISIVFSACEESLKKSIIDIEKVKTIEINDKFEKQDTALSRKKLLNEKQSLEFVNMYNNSIPVGPIKTATKFFITVHFKDGEVRNFRGFGQYLNPT
jgi:hypothetical protein